MSGNCLGRACQARPLRRFHAGLPSPAGPLRRVAAGDGVVYYSPSDRFGAWDGLRSFTAVACVGRRSLQFDMGGGFCPFRRNVDWAASGAVSISSLLDRLDFTAGRPNWGYQLRLGLCPLSEHDFLLDRASHGRGHGVG